MIDSEAITVHIDVFEGPMDLLLYLIRKNNLDIYDIPIAQITKEYLAYIEVMKDLNLEVAGEFLVMASTLMQIKAKTLLPSQVEADGSEGPDPASELISKIQEYQRYKAVCQILDKRYDEFKDVFYRGSPVFPDSDKVLSVDLFELISCVRKALEQTEEKAEANVQAELFPIETRMEKILNMLSQKYWIRLEDIFAGETKRRGVITCFMAMLELMKQRRVLARQDSNFQEIRIYLRPEPKTPDADELPLVDGEQSAPSATEPLPAPPLDDIPSARGLPEATEPEPALPLPEETPSPSLPEATVDEILSAVTPAEPESPAATYEEKTALPEGPVSGETSPAATEPEATPRPVHPAHRDLRPEIEEYTRFAHELSDMVDKDVAEGVVQAVAPVEREEAVEKPVPAPDFVEKAVSALSALEDRAGESAPDEPEEQGSASDSEESGFVRKASSILSVLEEKASLSEGFVPPPARGGSVADDNPLTPENRPVSETDLTKDDSVPPEGGPKEN